jgi:SAM-dependent methyltransferase
MQYRFRGHAIPNSGYDANQVFPWQATAGKISWLNCTHFASVQSSNVAMKIDYCLPPTYIERESPDYFDDVRPSARVNYFQPEVYVLAEYLAAADRRSCVLDIGCGNGEKLAMLQCASKVGLDHGGNLARFRSQLPGARAIEHDLETHFPVLDIDPTQTVVIGADVVEHLRDPRPMMEGLARLCDAGAVVIMSTPDRVRVRGEDDRGPPQNPAHVREWALDEWMAFAASRGLRPVFAGYTINSTVACAKKTIVSIHHAPVERVLKGSVDRDRPLAIMSVYNEIDIIEQTLRRCFDEGFDIHFIDNWSTDGSFEILRDIADSDRNHISLERFPATGPSDKFLWNEILMRKAAVASQFPGRWIIHWDADEVRESAWHGMTLRRSLEVIEAAGYNAADFCVAHFRPTHDGFGRGDNVDCFTHFAYALRPGHFIQTKAWIQPQGIVDLAASGGHRVQFDRIRTFPYRMLLRHYALRSSQQALRKLDFRVSRWNPNARQSFQRNELSGATDFVWKEEELHAFDPNQFRKDHLVELVSDVVWRRRAPNWAPIFGSLEASRGVWA